MPKLITAYARKGGVGKSTITANLAAGLARLGKKVLIVNADGQNNSLRMLSRTVSYSNSLIDLAGTESKKRSTIKDCALRLRDNIDGIASERISELSKLLVYNEENPAKVFRVMFPLKEMAEYDFVFFDLGPDESLLNTMILKQIDGMILVVGADYEGVSSIQQLRNYFRQQNIDEDIIKCVATNLLKKSTTISKLCAESIKNLYMDKAIPPIPQKSLIANSSSMGKSIFDDNKTPEDIAVPFAEMLKVILSI